MSRAGPLPPAGSCPPGDSDSDDAVTPMPAERLVGPPSALTGHRAGGPTESESSPGDRDSGCGEGSSGRLGYVI